ncbi:hypothetical protein SAY86_029125 [Trapa natans]|uniref:Uncharacterized protein n=1 Tax=Trapa natans TaxID=22666 RepID=A0AAN7M388_TRANT|nr:hypothetical protein SAY86_029125 [Trapa natans]
MHLGSCDHVHFIQAVGGGEVTKFVHVSRGRPAPVFKKANGICKFQGKERTYPSSRVCSGKRFHASQVDPIKVKVKVPDHPVGTDQWYPDFNSSVYTKEHEDDSDELNFGNVTLQRMREKCIMKKRKLSTCATVSGKNCTVLSEKESCSSAQLEEDDIDLKRPLVKWKAELRKNATGQQKKSKRKHVTPPFKNATVVEETKQTFLDHPFQQSDSDLPMPLPNKVDFPEDYHIDHEMAVSMPDGSFITDIEQVESHILCAREVIQHADEDIPYIEFSSPESHVKGTQDDRLNSAYDKLDSSEDTLEIRDCTKVLQSTYLNVDNMSLLSDAEPISHHSSPQHVEPDDAELSFTFETRSTDHHANNSTLKCQKNLSPSCTVLSPLAYDSSENTERLFQMPAYADVEETYIDKIPSSDAVSVQTLPERIKNNGSLDLQYASQRLNSTRKVISPASQELLCKAMRSQELSDGLHKCRGKLHFRKQGNEKIPFVEKKDQVMVSELTGRLNKQKNDRTGSLSEGSENICHLSGAKSSQTGAEGNITRSSSESAIAFSQRQMKDIENLVLKLMGVLKSVKEIAEEASNSGACLSAQSKYNPDEVYITVEADWENLAF